MIIEVMMYSKYVFDSIVIATIQTDKYSLDAEQCWRLEKGNAHKHVVKE